MTATPMLETEDAPAVSEIIITCGQCGHTGPVSDFKKQKSCRLGVTKICNKCARGYAARYALTERGKEIRAINSAKNYAKYKSDPEYHALVLSQKKEARKRWVGRNWAIKHSQNYRKANPEKELAKRLVRDAIRRGDLVRPEACPRCGKSPETIDGRTGIHAHHHNGYDNPLDVIWLCYDCHVAEHRAAMVKAIRGGA